MIKMVTVIGPLIGLLLGALVTWAMPRVYQSEIVITVSTPNSNLGPNAPTSTCAICDAAEFDKITSPTTLRKAAETLDLSIRWHVTEGEAVRMLLGMVSWRDIPKTRQISIGVRHTDRVEARNIAAEVARVYLEYRLESAERHHQQVMRELEQTIEDQERVVEESRNKFESIDRVIDRNRGPSGTSLLLHLKYTVDDYFGAKRDLESETDRLQTLRRTHSMEQSRMPCDMAVVGMAPMISDSPLPPNIPLNLTLGAVSGLLLAPLMAWRSRHARTGSIAHFSSDRTPVTLEMPDNTSLPTNINPNRPAMTRRQDISVRP